MSTLNATNIKHGSSGTNNIVLDSAGNVTIGNDLSFNGNVANDLNVTGDISSTGDVQMASLNGGPLAGFRNKIINGACQIAQRSTSEAGVTASGYYTCDRWYFPLSSLGTWTVSQSGAAPDGFSNSFKIDCTTADTSPAANDFLYINQRIEGQDLQDLQYGLTGAKTITLSFWVRSNKTGTASFTVRQIDSGRQYSTTYTIDSTNTWEYKTITIPGDVASQIDNDNGIGLSLEWWLNSGSTYTGGSTQDWGASNNTNRNPSNFELGNATTNEFFLTGAQLELGPVATPFEHRSYGAELALSRRYYAKFTMQVEAAGKTDVWHHGMRATPTATPLSGGASAFPKSADYTVMGSSGSTQNATVEFDAEL